MPNTEQTSEVRALRISTESAPTEEKGLVIVERPITISIEGIGDYILMCTPSDVVALAAGFAYTEGLITSTDDIKSIRRCSSDPYTIRIRLSSHCSAEKASRARNLIVTSSCGICGTKRIAEVLDMIPHPGSSMRVALSTILDAHKKMRTRQKLFAETGGAHAAALFTSEGEIVGFAEDIGRHNAVDKAVGKLLFPHLTSFHLQEGETRAFHLQEDDKRLATGLGLAFSGRVSFEIVAKAARAGIELIAAVSAPSSLAIDAANRCGMTLCGFVRGDRSTVYCHDFRIAS
ncbi:MAG: formate dehydrogenase accessory sulfurtransferase FdhD [Armatimonadetes bacterium]|nr:formate dehydrogenase accessory sulfurtransferase FdhD [Armatimonadota bacterium]